MADYAGANPPYVRDVEAKSFASLVQLGGYHLALIFSLITQANLRYLEVRLYQLFVFRQARLG